MLPELIDRYQIQSEIGRGGMAIIYLAYDPQHHRQVAIKVLPPEYLRDHKFRARFQREIEIMISVRHPGIVPIYGYGQFQGQLYLVMRYMSGGSLEDRIDRQGILSIGETALLIEQIAPILEAAHTQGVIHRDLKPSNILFDAQGQPFISDFGIARLTEQSNIAALTGKTLIGSPAYMSPEQGRIGISLDGRSDIYSLGVMVFEMLTGQLPYQADSPMKLVLKHIMEPVPDILAVNPSLPPECMQIIQRAMAKDPEQRFPNAVELASALSDTTQAVRYPSAPPAVQAPIGSEIPTRKRGPIKEPAPAKKLSLPRVRFPRRLRLLRFPRRLGLPRWSLPAFLYSFTRPLSKYFHTPTFFRSAAVPHTILPGFLRPILGFFGLPTSMNLPSNKIWRVIIVIMLAVAVMALIVELLTGCYLLFRLQVHHSAAASYLNIFY